MKKGSHTIKAVDFFCSGGGMTAGFRSAGIKVVGGIDVDPDCRATYEFNNPGSKFVLADIRTLNPEALQTKLDIRRSDDDLIFIGCSPCQYWTKIQTNKTKSKETKDLLIEFQRFVHFFRPGTLVIENVPGLAKPSDDNPLSKFLEFLDLEGYSFVYNILDTSLYGVPQTRKRFVLIASRLQVQLKLPRPDETRDRPTVRDFIGNADVFPVVEAGHLDDSDFQHSVSRLSPDNKRRLELTPTDGGTRMAWANTELQISAYRNKDSSFRDIYGRMHWDRPAPTITTRFCSITNGRFGHPEQHRGISIREGATLQTFDIKYRFLCKSRPVAARIIGNAVPPAFSKRIASNIIEILNV